MVYKEITDDLFNYAIKFGSNVQNQNSRIPVHCISSDYVMGAGIAVPMAQTYGLRPALKMYKVYKPCCLFVNNVMNLITKKNVYDKPTYKTLTDALMDCKTQCLSHKVKYLVMPLIGCGIDGLEWSRVSLIVRSVFSDTDIDILVCVRK